MQSVLLSITIPTWNRASLLKELLEELSIEIISSNLSSCIEIFVINNGSDDNTESICKLLIIKYPFIKYRNNVVNIGARDNVLSCFKYTNGKYLILLGDDDRINKGSLIKVTNFLKQHSEIDLLLDVSPSKYYTGKTKKINLLEVSGNYFYLLGNAGVFIFRSELGKAVLRNYSYDFFNRSWPQTQLILLALNSKISDCIVFESPMHINSQSKHDQVMVYNSHYLIRTTFFDLLSALNSIKDLIDSEVFHHGRRFLTKSLLQVSYNVIQCGVFVDAKDERKNTINFIKKQFYNLKLIEKIEVSIIILFLKLPVRLSEIFLNTVILILKGKNGLQKKNDFVKMQHSKKVEMINNSLEIRTFDFSKH